MFYTHGIAVLIEIGCLFERFNSLVYFLMYINTICVILDIDSNKSILNVLIFA